jgi:hypothetical protein
MLQITAACMRRGWDRAGGWILAFYLLTSGYMLGTMFVVTRVKQPIWWLWLPATYLIVYLASRSALLRREPLAAA